VTSRAETNEETMDENSSSDPLRDSIETDTPHDPEPVPLNERQMQELRRRSEAYRRNPASAVPLDDVLERIERSPG
jgi:putative addiction module component (TIGR02574 family)